MLYVWKPKSFAVPNLLFDNFAEGKTPKYIEIGGMIDLHFPIQIHSFDLIEVLMRPLSFDEFVLYLLVIKLFLVTYRRLFFGNNIYIVNIFLIVLFEFLDGALLLFNNRIYLIIRFFVDLCKNHIFARFIANLDPRIVDFCRDQHHRWNIFFLNYFLDFNLRIFPNIIIFG